MLFVKIENLLEAFSTQTCRHQHQIVRWSWADLEEEYLSLWKKVPFTYVHSSRERVQENNGIEWKQTWWSKLTNGDKEERETNAKFTLLLRQVVEITSTVLFSVHILLRKWHSPSSKARWWWSLQLSLFTFYLLERLGKQNASYSLKPFLSLASYNSLERSFAWERKKTFSVDEELVIA